MTNLQERLRQMASIAITHPQFTDYVNNALEAALKAADALDQKDARIEELEAEIARLTAEGAEKDRLLHDAAVYLRECGKQFAAIGDHVMQAGCYSVAERITASNTQNPFDSDCPGCNKPYTACDCGYGKKTAVDEQNDNAWEVCPRCGKIADHIYCAEGRQK